MTYIDFILRSAETPRESRHALQVCYNHGNGWYKIFGAWHGQQINISAPNYNKAVYMVNRLHGISIPQRKNLIFSHCRNGMQYAIVQGFLPGSCIIDMSDFKPRKAERK